MTIPATIQTAIQQQMLQTLLQAMQAGDAALQAGQTVEAVFLRWMGAAPNAGATTGAALPNLQFAAGQLAPDGTNAAPSPGVATPTQATPANIPAPLLAEARIGSARVTLALSPDAQRAAQLTPGATLTLAVDQPQRAGAPAEVRLVAITPPSGDAHTAARPAPSIGSTPSTAPIPAADPASARPSDASGAARNPVSPAALQHAERSAAMASPGVATARLNPAGLFGEPSEAQRLSPELAPARAVAGPILAKALARQDGLAPLFANVEAVAKAAAPLRIPADLALPPAQGWIPPGAAGTLPRPMVDAALNLLGFRLPSAPERLDGATLKTAVERSGLMHEAALARGRPEQAKADLKGALVALKQSLGAAAGSEPRAVAGDRATATLAIPSREAASAPSDPLRAIPPDGKPQLLPNAQPDGRPSLPLPEGAEPKERQTAQTNPANPAELRPAPPRRDGQPVPQSIALPTIDPQTEPAPQIVAKLLAQTEAALDRIALSQYASLPSPTDGPGQSVQRWFAELPLAIDGRTGVLPLEIERDKGGNAGGASGEPPRKQWRVRFALDLEPLGLIHALVTMSRHAVQVAVWAEREETSRLAREFAPELQAALTRESFETAEIDVLTGRPRPRAAAAGHYLDRRS